MSSNELFLVVLPLIHLDTGLTEQVLTLVSQRDSATEFFPDEVGTYISFFEGRANKYLTGGHVTGYGLDQEVLENGRIIVRVTQNVG